MKKILIIFLISLFGRTALLLAEGEFLIDTSIVYGPAGGTQVDPSIAFDGTNYLVVWRDSRDGFYNIYGTRVNQSGKVIDTTGIVISTKVGYQRHLAVAFDGTNYLAIWRKDHEIYAARIDQAGIVLDTASILIYTCVAFPSWPSIAFDGTNYLVVWEGYLGSGWHIYGVRVSPSGAVLDTEAIEISTGTVNAGEPSVAFNGINYLVVWRCKGDTTSSDIYGARVTPSGAVWGPKWISAKPEGETSPSVASCGTNYLVVWEQCDKIYGTRVSQSFHVLDTAGIIVSTTSDPKHSPSVTSDGTNYLVVWNEVHSGSNNDIYGARVGTSGTVLDSIAIPISTAPNNQTVPCVAYGNINYLIAWKDDRSTSCSDVYGARMNQMGIVPDTTGIVFSISENAQTHSSVAFDGTNYLVGWDDFHSGYSDIYGTRVHPSGEILDPLGIDRVTQSGNQYSPSIAFNGTNYLFVWIASSSGTHYYAIYGIRVSPSGNVIDTVPILISSDTTGYKSSVAVASDSTNYLVMWNEEPYGPLGLCGTRIDSSGRVLDTAGIKIPEVHLYSRLPSIAFDGTNYLVTWEDLHVESPYCHYYIYGARVNQSGELLDSTYIHIAYPGHWPSVAFDGTHYLVVWATGGIYGAIVDTTGVVLDSGIAICVAEGTQLTPAVIFDGTNYFVVWQDKRDGNWDIYGALVDTSGVVIDSFDVSTRPGDQIEPAVVKGPSNQLLITWSGWTPEINSRPANTMRIWGKFYPLTGVEEKEKLRVESSELNVFPNPFNKKAMINYQLPAKGKVSLKIYDLTGRLVKVLVDKEIKAGNYKIKWDGRDSQNKNVPNGIYFCKIEAGDFKAIEKLVILK